MTRLAHRLSVDPTGLAQLLTPRDDVVAEVGGPDGFGLAEGPFRTYRRSVEVVEHKGDKIEVDQAFEYTLAVPPWWTALFHFPVKRALLAPPSLGTQPWWAPPQRLDTAATHMLGVLCTLAVVAGYLGTVIGQTLTFAADEFGSTDRDQGILLALVRIGTLASVVATVLADRRGRRPLITACMVGAMVATVLGAAAPDLVLLGTSQTIARGLTTAVGVLIGVIAAETLPAGCRAYGLAVITLSAALGSGMVLWVLPVADLGEQGWRTIYAVPVLAVPLVVWALRALPETARFERTAADDAERADPGSRIDRSRLALLGVTSMLTLFFAAPASQFQNEFLRDERGFSAATITLFVLLTTLPASAAVFFGGRIADRHGRRLVASVGLVGVTLFTITSYLASGWVVWVAAALRSSLGGLIAPALGVYGPELFSTRSRAGANGIVSLVGVVGSASGLLVVGALSDRFGGLGEAFLVAGIAPLAVAAIVWFAYPETSGIELEDLNRPDGRPSRPNR